MIKTAYWLLPLIAASFPLNSYANFSIYSGAVLTNKIESEYSGKKISFSTKQIYSGKEVEFIPYQEVIVSATQYVASSSTSSGGFRENLHWLFGSTKGTAKNATHASLAIDQVSDFLATKDVNGFTKSVAHFITDITNMMFKDGLGTKSYATDDYAGFLRATLDDLSRIVNGFTNIMNQYGITPEELKKLEASVTTPAPVESTPPQEKGIMQKITDFFLRK